MYSKSYQIESMTEEADSLQLCLSTAATESNLQFLYTLELENQIRQNDIKQDLETSHLKTKLKLLEETLTNKNKDLKALQNFKKNNEQLLVLLEK